MLKSARVPRTFSPLYRQIKALLLESLRSGAWRPGEAIPSAMDLGQPLQGEPGYGAQGHR
jgi:GntR family transcriptional regulator